MQGVGQRQRGTYGGPPVMAAAAVQERELSAGGLWEAFKWLLLVTGIAAAIYLPVYFFHHPYKPKSPVALLMGIVGGGMMFCGALFYIIRKRVRALKQAGQMKYWLNAHIMFCLFGPLLVIYHSALSVKSLNSGVALYAMLTVVASGVAGRYIYRHFQLTLSGERTSLKEMQDEADGLTRSVMERFPDSEGIVRTITGYFSITSGRRAPGLLRSLMLMVRLDRVERSLTRQIEQYARRGGRPTRPGTPHNPRSAERQLIRLISVQKKIAALEATSTLFASWHKLHVPLIWVLVVTVILHMASVFLL